MNPGHSIISVDKDRALLIVDSPSRDMLEELTLASGPMDRPVAMFVDKSDPGLTKAAIKAGVSAYVVDGLRADRVKPILDAAIARFHMFQRMRTDLATTKRALEERKVIDRAKGSLMKAKRLTEEQAYALLRKAAMDQGRKVADVAEALVTRLEALAVLSVNGTKNGMSTGLANRLRQQGYGFDFADAAAAGRALLAATAGPLRIGVPVPFSMHAALFHYWLAGLDHSAYPPAPGISIHTVPPPLMAAERDDAPRQRLCGLVGLKAAAGLKLRSMAETVIHIMGHLTERQLDPAAGYLLQKEPLCKVPTEQKAINVTVAFVQLYHEHAKYLDWPYKWLAKMGLPWVQSRVVTDLTEPAALIARFDISRTIYQKDPRAERSNATALRAFAPLANLTREAAE